MYVQHSVDILREVSRILRPDGVLFWNIGDSYSGGGRETHGTRIGEKEGTNRGNSDPAFRLRNSELKPKDLCLIPARVALAAQADGWWVRSDIIWNKPNPMPESVRDRPTDAYEHILMITKSARYYWDAEAVKEPGVSPEVTKEEYAVALRDTSESWHQRITNPFKDGKKSDNNLMAGKCPPGGRNLRNVWTFATQPYKGAHFATFPVELVIRCLQAATKPGDLVLDPFGGSGTVGEVAFNMGRRFVLCDLAYQDLQRQRIPPMDGKLVMIM